MSSPSLQGQIAIVTGASSGIGKAIALALAAEGAHVALAARNVAALEEVAARIRALGREALVAPTDVTSREQVERAVAATLERWGRVDILVANAGVYVRSSIPELTVEHMERSMAVNFYGGLHAALAVMPAMLTRGQGHIVFLTSMDARKGLPLDAPYVAAKAALSGVGGVMRQELRERGVHVMVVYPGRVDTPLVDNLDVPAISAKIPPEAVARAVVRGIRRRRAEIVMPLGSRLLDWANILSPRLGDWIVRAFHLEGWERAS